MMIFTNVQALFPYFPSHRSHPSTERRFWAAPWLRLPAPSRALCPADPGNRASGAHQISKKNMASINISPWKWPIEIDGLPFLKMGGSFHGYVSHNQMVIFGDGK